MALWYSELDRKEKRTLLACFGGWALDSFDVNLFALIIPTLIALFGFSKGAAGLLATVTLFISALGGWISGMLADRFGRVRMLQVAILFYAVFTFLSGFASNFTAFFIFRALQGLGYGGEWAAGAVLMGEIIRPRYRGRAVGTVQSAWAVGWGLSVLAQAIVFSLLPPEWAWRALFWIGVLPAGLVLYVRRFIDEPAVFDADRRRERIGMLSQLVTIFQPRYLRVTLTTFAFTSGALGGYNAIALWLPSFLQMSRHLSIVASTGYLAFVIIGSFCGFISGAHCADWFGRKPTFILAAVGSIVVTAVYALAPLDSGVLRLLGFPLGYFNGVLFAPMGSFLTELYPTAVRGTGQGFAYNGGRAVAGVFPTLVGYFAASLGGLGPAIGLFSLTAYAIMFVALLTLPETRGRDLPAELDGASLIPPAAPRPASPAGRVPSPGRARR